MKNIVICCDGTMGKYGTRSENTNVVRLFERLIPDGREQVSYYDPGVGAYSPLRTPLGAAGTERDRVRCRLWGEGECVRSLQVPHEPL